MPAWLRFFASFACCLAVAALSAAEDVPDHAHKQQKTITLDNENILPSDLTMGTDDALVLQNSSVHLMEITFIDPKDAATKIRCGLARMPADKRPPWAVFDIRDGRYVGVIPPGRFGSLCSLSPGSYSFVVRRLDADAPPVGGELPPKGQITVR